MQTILKLAAVFLYKLHKQFPVQIEQKPKTDLRNGVDRAMELARSKE